MSSFVKALIVVVACIITLSFIAIGIGYYWWSEHGEAFIENSMQVITEGKEFGQKTDNDGCLAEALSRYKQNRGFSDAIKINIFFQECLENSTQSPGFCENVPNPIEFMKSTRWQKEQCSQVDLPEQYCSQLFAQIQTYCEYNKENLQTDNQIIDLCIFDSCLNMNRQLMKFS